MVGAFGAGEAALVRAFGAGEGALVGAFVAGEAALVRAFVTGDAALVGTFGAGEGALVGTFVAGEGALVTAFGAVRAGEAALAAAFRCLRPEALRTAGVQPRGGHLAGGLPLRAEALRATRVEAAPLGSFLPEALRTGEAALATPFRRLLSEGVRFGPGAFVGHAVVAAPLGCFLGEGAGFGPGAFVGYAVLAAPLGPLLTEGVRFGPGAFVGHAVVAAPLGRLLTEAAGVGPRALVGHTVLAASLGRLLAEAAGVGSSAAPLRAFLPGEAAPFGAGKTVLAAPLGRLLAEAVGLRPSATAFRRFLAEATRFGPGAAAFRGFLAEVTGLLPAATAFRTFVAEAGPGEPLLAGDALGARLAEAFLAPGFRSGPSLRQPASLGGFLAEALRPASLGGEPAPLRPLLTAEAAPLRAEATRFRTLRADATRLRPLRTSTASLGTSQTTRLSAFLRGVRLAAVPAPALRGLLVGGGTVPRLPGRLPRPAFRRPFRVVRRVRERLARVPAAGLVAGLVRGLRLGVLHRRLHQHGRRPGVGVDHRRQRRRLLDRLPNGGLGRRRRGLLRHPARRLRGTAVQVRARGLHGLLRHLRQRVPGRGDVRDQLGLRRDAVLLQVVVDRGGPDPHAVGVEGHRHGRGGLLRQPVQVEPALGAHDRRVVQVFEHPLLLVGVQLGAVEHRAAVRLVAVEDPGDPEARAGLLGREPGHAAHQPLRHVVLGAREHPQLVGVGLRRGHQVPPRLVAVVLQVVARWVVELVTRVEPGAAALAVHPGPQPAEQRGDVVGGHPLLGRPVFEEHLTGQLVVAADRPVGRGHPPPVPRSGPQQGQSDLLDQGVLLGRVQLGRRLRHQAILTGH